MLSVSKISLTQFKNYTFRTFSFSKRVIGITGRNGSGKTNLLDAIYYLCFTKSYFNATETQNVRYDTNGFRLEALFQRGTKDDKIVCTVKDGKKDIALNDESYEKFSRHIGQFPAVMIAPDDAEIILGGSEDRRRWLDSLLCQLYPGYMEHLIAYHKILQQRNSLLKTLLNLSHSPDALLDVFDEQLVRHGVPVFDIRRTFLETFIGQVQDKYDYLAGRHETVAFRYQSQLTDEDFSSLLRTNRLRDKQLQRTTHGIHRDDLLFLLDEHPMKSSASQGQRKSFLFALKLAQYETIRAQKHFPPILLLDDVFEKLDQERVSRLIHLVQGNDYGQVFITDTHEDRLRQAFSAQPDMLQLIPMQES